MLALAALPLLAAPKKQDTRAKIAVLDLKAEGAPKELAASATAVLASELAKLDVFRVISRDDLRNLLSFEKERQYLAGGSIAAAVVAGRF